MRGHIRIARDFNRPLASRVIGCGRPRSGRGVALALSSAATSTFVLIVALVFGPSMANATDVENGVVALRAIPDGAAIQVDGVPISLANAEKGIELSVGSHLVDVVFPDGRTVAYPVSVTSGSSERLRVSRKPSDVPEGEGGLAPFPIWPAVASSVATVVFGAAALAYGIVFMRSLGAYETARDLALRDDGVGSAAPFSIVGRDLQTKSAAMRADGITTAILGPAAVSVGVATAAFWAFYVVTLPSGDPE